MKKSEIIFTGFCNFCKKDKLHEIVRDEYDNDCFCSRCLTCNETDWADYDPSYEIVTKTTAN
ncbi:TPA: hypothetical protein ACX3GY_000646 [Vibrio parahaemolyticus]